jgi:glycosyltransferase involved in cell wall biosynthesis
MRAAWFSPTAGNSGIVEYTRQILPELARHLDVQLFSDGVAESPPPGIPVVDYRRDADRLAELDDYDLTFFNLGNHLGFHRRELEISRNTRGVIVLHDRTLHHLWAGWYLSTLDRADIYTDRMATLYGARGAEVAAAFVALRSEEAWSHPTEILCHSFLPDTLAGALGAVVHCHGHAAEVRRAWTGPVCDLPFPAYPSQLQRPVTPAVDLDRRMRLVSIGHVDGHKQLHATIDALRLDRGLADRVTYTIVGGYDARSGYVRDLNRAIADGGLARTVRLVGFQPAAGLQRYLDEADVFVNLRMPNLESGSATLMEQMARGRPVVVHPGGSFADLPDDVVVKVRGADARALARTLSELADDTARRAAVGAAARGYAEGVSADGYARALAQFAQRAAGWRVKGALTAATGEALRWLGADDSTRAMAAAEIDWLLG